MADVKSYFSVETNGAAVWLRDGRIAFLNNKSGTSQIWVTDENGAPPRQWTFGNERIWRLSPTPGNDAVLFASDLGGNEQEQIFLLREGEEKAVNLSDNPNARHYLGGLTPDGQWVYYAGNRRSPAHFDIMKKNVKTGEEITVLQNEDNYNIPCAVSPDGRYMLYNKLKGMSDNKMWIVDMLSGDARDIDPKGAYAQYGAPAWKSDSTGFYLTTDADSEFVYVAYYDVRSETLARIYTDPWDIEGLALSCDDRYLAMAANADGYGEMKILDLKTNTLLDTVRPPRGFINTYSGMEFSPQGHKLLFNFSSGRRPAGIWMMDLDADALRRVTESPLGDIAEDDLVEPELREFHSFDGLRVPYWLYRARDAKQPGPVVLEIHGGPEGQEFPMYTPLLQYLVSQGLSIAAPNVRGSTGYGKRYHHLDDVEKRLDSVRDVACLVKHLIASGIADPKRIAVMGASYGGYMTLASITNYPGLWAAAVDTVGMSDLETFLENTAEYRRAHRESEYGTLSHDRETLRRVSPIHQVDKIIAPLMVIHGAKDPRVPVSEADQIVESLQKRGVPVKYLRYPDEGHGLSKRKNQFDCYPQVAAFLKEHLKEQT